MIVVLGILKKFCVLKTFHMYMRYSITEKSEICGSSRINFFFMNNACLMLCLLYFLLIEVISALLIYYRK